MPTAEHIELAVGVVRAVEKTFLLMPVQRVVGGVEIEGDLWSRLRAASLPIVGARLTLREASYAPVQYIPRRDVDMTRLERTDHATYCPYKGDCSYFSIPSGGDRSTNAVWTYEAPYEAVSPIKDHVAFYPARVDAIEERRGD